MIGSNAASIGVAIPGGAGSSLSPVPIQASSPMTTIRVPSLIVTSRETTGFVTTTAE